MTTQLRTPSGRSTPDQPLHDAAGWHEAQADVLGLAALRRTPGWDGAMRSLRAQWQQHGAAARERAARKRREFRSRRGTMVVDVVLSRQRRYDTHVRPCLDRWDQTVAGQEGVPTLRWLVDNPDLVAAPTLPLRKGEAATILGVASALLRYGTDLGIDPDDEDRACESWANAVAGLEFAPKLDPYVGAVAGIGAALFAYTRKLCGADTVKPDVRVLAALRRHGVDLPGDNAAGFIAVTSAAHELGIPVIELDQILWLDAPDRSGSPAECAQRSTG
jgi:hypothetical protein